MKNVGVMREPAGVTPRDEIAAPVNVVSSPCLARAKRGSSIWKSQ